MEVHKINEDVENKEEESVNERKKVSPEDIEEIFKILNFNSHEIAPIIQNLYASIPVDKQTDEYKILEVDDHILEALNAGDSVTFRGDENEPAVLCSGTRTYEVREAETSNSCLVVPDLKCKDEVWVEGLEGHIVEDVDITAFYNKYLEIRECRPRLDKLLTVLEPSSFKGMEYEKLIDPSTFYDWDKLRSVIQASDAEILEALPQYLIAEIDGFYRLISFEYEARIVPCMIDLLEENSWEIDEVDKEIAYESLKDLCPKQVFDLLFQKYTTLSTKTSKDGHQLYKFDESKICRQLAHILLTASSSNAYEDFMEAWKMTCPDNVQPKEDYLYGIAIVRWNNQTMKKEVALYPESSLPDNINKRLDELFKAKEKWTLSEISPYISKFATRSQDVTAILTKLTRSSTSNGVKYYSAKHGK